MPFSLPTKARHLQLVNILGLAIALPAGVMKTKKPNRPSQGRL